jgi:phosphoribosylanthranilate isomerase
MLFDAKPPRDAALPGGNGVAFDWSLLADFDRSIPFMLSGGLDHANVAAAISIANPGGVDVSSGVERAPGRKRSRAGRGFHRRRARGGSTEGFSALAGGLM